MYNPAIMRFKAQQDAAHQMQQMQMQQQQQQQQGGMEQQGGQLPPGMQGPQNPIASGSQSAMQASRASLQMNEGQGSRAMAKALMAFSARPVPQRGESSLSSFNAGMKPALEAYDMERQQAEAQNSEQMRHQEKMMQQQRGEEMQKLGMIQKNEALQQQQNYQTKKLGIMAAQMAAQGAKTTKDQREAEKIEEAFNRVPEGAIPWEAMSVGQKNEAFKQDNANIKTAQAAEKAIHTAEEISSIIGQHPKIWKSYAMALQANDPTKPTFGEVTMMNWGLNKEDRTALQKVRKLQNTMVLNQAAGSGGKVVSDMWKKLALGATPDFSVSPEAAKYMVNHLKEESAPLLSAGRQSRKNIKGRYHMPGELHEEQAAPLQERAAPAQRSEAPAQEGAPDLKDLSLEELERMEAEAAQQEGR